MKSVALVLMTIMTGILVAGTLWLLLAMALTGWLKWVVGFAGFAIATGLNLGIFWLLWPRTGFADDDDD